MATPSPQQQQQQCDEEWTDLSPSSDGGGGGGGDDGGGDGEIPSARDLAELARLLGAPEDPRMKRWTAMAGFAKVRVLPVLARREGRVG